MLEDYIVLHVVLFYRKKEITLYNFNAEFDIENN